MSCTAVTSGMEVLHKLETLPTKREGIFIMPTVCDDTKGMESLICTLVVKLAAAIGASHSTSALAADGKYSS